LLLCSYEFSFWSDKTAQCVPCFSDSLEYGDQAL
jgi:hypothetical protein